MTQEKKKKESENAYSFELLDVEERYHMQFSCERVHKQIYHKYTHIHTCIRQLYTLLLLLPFFFLFLLLDVVGYCVDDGKEYGN